MWKVSFRGIPIRTERVFWSTIRYVHLNPVRWGMVARPEGWREEDGANWPLREKFEAGI
jgi:REP element-mobilizing transposase RayT